MTEPVFRVLRGQPDEPELVALTVALVVLAATNPAPPPTPPLPHRRPAWIAQRYQPPGAWSRETAVPANGRGRSNIRSLL
ncbi:hypothetical protein BAY61_07815 [Prauserella marina]|uniref:Acyl-CoA carboxylase epsilon subunit n=1 Tax=Prauserella marina TaxID=530584 RepID=A0A222VMF7_9PSEU|nr:acyl-CoA carboxylase epsilon subunit [Prauserella marina]ASR34901.1 hypothetical protein BAY61_07815 [Prauserella marina]PWV85393.1 acyl-CoA carboxylase epsilon subunit-like protein [Prauserella marina]SDC55901.1 Acyl-CoA carboxylase epsilon subunit [Prauserella marina]